MTTQLIFRACHDALPFLDCDDLLKVTLDPDIGREYSILEGGGVANLGARELADSRSCLHFQFDLEQATERLSLEPHQLEWAVVAKDPHMRRLAVMERARFEPDEGTITTLLDSYGSHGLVGYKALRLELLIILADTLPPDAIRPQAKGSVVARSVVELRRAGTDAPFPINYADSAWFQDRGLPRATLWWLELMKGATPETDPAAAIRVTLSDSLRTVMNGLERGSPITRSYADYVASDLLVELVRVVMNLQGDALFPDDPRGLLGHLANAFAHTAQDAVEVLEYMRRLHRGDPGRIRAEAQQLVAATDDWRAIRRRETTT